MIDALKPYPAMKHSGVPWLGATPEHWDLKRAKWLFRKMNRPVRDGDEVVTCFRDGTVTLRTNRRTRGFTEALKEIGYQGIRRGDLVIHAMDAFAGAVGVADCDGKGSPVYSDCKPGPRADAHYYAYAVREMARSRWLEALAKGIRERSSDFRFEAFGSEPVPHPPLAEQRAIVRYLDHADRRIRRYIRAKRKLIKLLEEQKQVIIHRAVTRGLDPNVRLKPSCVEWLRDVPEHWEVRRLKSLVSRVTSGSRGWSNFAANGGPLFIRIGNLTRASIDLDLEKEVRLQLPNRVLAEAARTRVHEDDILLSITAFIGSVAVVPAGTGEAYVSQHVACCRPHAGSNPRWIAYVLLSSVGQTHGQLSMYGGTKQGLSLDDVKNYVVLVPPVREQNRLVEWIDSASSTVDAGIRSAKREMELLREYRTRLTADVVSGKLDVREAATRMPEEPVEKIDDSWDVEGPTDSDSPCSDEPQAVLQEVQD